MHKIVAMGSTVPLTVPAGTIASAYRFRFVGPPAALPVPDVSVPYDPSAIDPITATSEVLTAQGIWTVAFALVDGVGNVLGVEQATTIDVPADVIVRVAAGLTVQVIVG